MCEYYIYIKSLAALERRAAESRMKHLYIYLYLLNWKFWQHSFFVIER